MIAHHLGCVLILTWCMAAEPPGASLFVVSTTFLEIGSGLSSLVEFYPRSEPMLRVFYWGMTWSNFQGILAMVVNVAVLQLNSWSITMMIVGVITIYFRQETALEYKENFAKIGSATLLNPEERAPPTK